MGKSSSYLQAVLAIAATLWILITARNVLQPFLIGLFVWFLLNATAHFYLHCLSRFGVSSRVAAKLLSALTVILVLVVLGVMASQSAAQFAANLPLYEEKLDALLEAAARAVGISEALQVSELLSKIDIAPAALNLAGSAASFLGALIVVIVYIVFISQEAHAAEAKLSALFAAPDQRAEATKTAEIILREIEIYIGVKVVLGLIQAIPTFLVLWALGIDAPIFWAMVIFAVSFIPTIGTIIGIAFPPLMALLQFDTISPFLIVLSVLVPVQLLASNYLEPRLMSRSLNLSPLVVFFGIFAGAAIWGIVGALIIVPLLAVAMIVFARIPSLRPAAILLSRDGKLTA